MNLHTVERIDVNDRLPRDESFVLCWGHNKIKGWRWVDVLLFQDGAFLCDEQVDHTEEVTHWADLSPLNWNDGLPFMRDQNQ